MSRRLSFSTTSPGTRAPNYANVTKKSPPPPAVRQAQSSSGASTENGMVKSNIARNAKGQRVDKPLRFSQADVFSLKRLKLCNQYHILGSCSWGQSCAHPHGDRLTKQQLEALKHIARMTRCPTGLACQDEDCIGGHRCPRSHCDPATCWFPPEMHGVDTAIVG